MRYAAVCLAALALATGCSPKPKEAAKAPAADSPMAAAGAARPRPQAGLWETTMKMGGQRPMTVSAQICLDQAMLKDDGWLSGAKDPATGACTQSFNRQAGGYAFKSVCRFGERTVTSEGVASGDFSNAYKVDLTSSMSPAPEGVEAQTTMSIAAQRLGPCPAGVAGGMIPGSAKMTPG